ncbi:MAG: hypothetical protein QOJ26_249 [Thermoplasmata archaeon]|nr:hypothetical protein [Thermoplasmata archaeon]
MRPSTIVVLLGLIVLFAFFGIQVFGWILAFVLATLLLAIAAVAVGLWYVKRRMRRKLEELGVAMERHLRDRSAEAGRSDAIDVEGEVRKPRDGADEPDQL